MATSISYEVSNRLGTSIPCMYRILSVDGSEIDRTQVGFGEVLAADSTVASSYISAMKDKLSSVASAFETATSPTTTLFEEGAALMTALDIFVNSYSDEMLPPVAP